MKGQRVACREGKGKGSMPHLVGGRAEEREEQQQREAKVMQGRKLQGGEGTG